MTTLYYLNEWSDETMPCMPTLQGWADWLDKADPTWGRDEPAEDGAHFDASAMEVIADIRAEVRDGVWTPVEPIPEAATGFYLRHHQGSEGWDADFSGGTIEDAMLDYPVEDQDAVWFACIRDLPPLLISFERTPEGPRCTVVGAVQ